jgi:hypothetical protein
MNFDAYYDIDCESLHGEGPSLQFIGVMSITNESIQGVRALDVANEVTKGMIQGVDVQQEAWGVMFVELQMNMTFCSPYSRISLAWAFFVLNDPTTRVQIQLVQNMKCIL